MSANAKTDATDRKTLMRMLDISAPALAKLGQAEGYMPRLSSGAIDIEATVRGYIQRMRARRAQTADQAERLTRAKADLAELEYDRERGALCDVRDVAACFAEMHRSHERACSADKTGLVAASLKQSRDDWDERMQKILTKKDSDDTSEN
jgi:hypothetical protein